MAMSSEVNGDEVEVKVNPRLTLILMPYTDPPFGMQGGLHPRAWLEARSNGLSPIPQSQN